MARPDRAKRRASDDAVAERFQASRSTTPNWVAASRKAEHHSSRG